MGLVTAQEAAEAVTSHILSRSLGTELSPMWNPTTTRFSPAMFCCCARMACTDRSKLPKWRRSAAMARISISQPEKLVALANDRGGGDNISVQIIRIRGVERMGMYRGRPYKMY